MENQKLQTLLKKVTPLFPSNPLLKVKVLSSPPFLKIWLEGQPPPPFPPTTTGGGGEGGGAHYDSTRFDKGCEKINNKEDKMTMVRQRYQLISSRDIDKEYWNLFGPEVYLASPKNGSLTFYLSWSISLCKKSIDSFKWYCQSKNPAIWLYHRKTRPYPTKSSCLRCYLPLIIISMQEI